MEFEMWYNANDVITPVKNTIDETQGIYWNSRIHGEHFTCKPFAKIA